MPVLRQNVYIVILFGRCGTGIILVFFSSPTAVTKWGVKYNGVGQFRKYRHLSQKRYEIGL